MSSGAEPAPSVQATPKTLGPNQEYGTLATLHPHQEILYSESARSRLAIYLVTAKVETR